MLKAKLSQTAWMLLCDGRKGCNIYLWTMNSAIQTFSGCHEVWDWTVVTEKNRGLLECRETMKLFLTQRRDANTPADTWNKDMIYHKTLKTRFWNRTAEFSHFYTSFTDLKTKVTPVHWIKGERKALNITALIMHSVLYQYFRRTFLLDNRTNFLSLFFLKQEGALKPSQTSLCYKVLL